MKKEIWKKLPGYGGKYEVSNLGRIRSYTYLKGDYRAGYVCVGLVCEDGVRRGKLVHRLVASAFLPNPQKKPVVNHKDFNRGNNSLDNLEWVTHKENSAHSNAQGRFDHARIKRSHALSGEGSPTAKLTWQRVRQLRKLHKTGKFTTRRLAEIFSINPETVRCVIVGKSWKEELRPT